MAIALPIPEQAKHRTAIAAGAKLVAEARTAPPGEANTKRAQAAALLLSVPRYVDDKARVGALFDLASQLFLAGRFIDALEPALVAVSLADQEYKDSVIAVRSRLLHGSILVNVLNFADAAIAFSAGRDLAMQLRLDAFHSTALSNLGALAMELGDYTGSAKLLRQAAHIAQTSTMMTATERDARIGAAMTNLASVHFRQFDYEQALRIARVAIDSMKAANEPGLVPYRVGAMCTAARALIKLERNEEARVIAAEALHVASAGQARASIIEAEAIVALTEVLTTSSQESVARLLKARDEARLFPGIARSVLMIAADAHEHQRDAVNALRMHREVAMHYRRLFLAAESQRRGLVASSVGEASLQEVEDKDLLALLKRQTSSEAALAGLAVLAESPIDATGQHVMRVAGLTALFAEFISYADEPISDLAFAALVSDIGMITVPPVTQTKPGALDDAEKAAIRLHPIEGVGFLSRQLKALHVIEEVVRHHHERWDGRGYPDGFAHDQIPRSARIVALADAFEVMTHGRPYLEAVSVEEALAEIERRTGTHFDPAIAPQFVEFIRATSMERTELNAMAVAWVKSSPLGGYVNGLDLRA